MNLDELNLVQVEERLAALDEEVRAASDMEAIEKAAEEKKQLLVRKAELVDLEKRKQTALDLNEGKIESKPFEIRKEEKKMNFEFMTPQEIRATPEYRSAFYKTLLGHKLNDVEKRVNEINTTDVVGVIPVSSSSRIFDLVRQYAPLLDEVTLLRVPGPVKFGVENTNTAAALHTETTTLTPAADDMTYVQLNAFEIAKVLRISKTVALQSIDAFESWLVAYLARGIAKKVGSYLIYGSGSGQPKGIDYMNTWSDASNAVDWAGAAPLIDELVEQVSYLKGGYHNGAKWLVNAQTFWGKIVAVQNDSKYKLLNPEYNRMLGYPILFDDNVAAGDLFFGNFREGMVANFSQDIKVERSSESGFLSMAYDFLGSTIFDCTVTHTEGFVKGANDLTAGLEMA